MDNKESGGEPPKFMIAFWAIAIAILTSVLMLIILMAIGFFRQMFHCKKYDKVGTFEDSRYMGIVADQWDDNEPDLMGKTGTANTDAE